MAASVRAIPAPLPDHEPFAQGGLKLDDELLDRNVGDVQLGGGAAIAAVPGDSLKGAQRVQRGNPVGHTQVFVKSERRSNESATPAACYGSPHWQSCHSGGRRQDMRSGDGKTRSVVTDMAGAGWDYSITRHPYHEHERPKGAHYCVYNRRLMAVCFDDHSTEDGYSASAARGGAAAYRRIPAGVSRTGCRAAAGPAFHQGYHQAEGGALRLWPAR